MIVNMGIKPKLLIAFGLILGTTLIASAIAISAFSKFSEALSGITQESVPFMAESMSLTQSAMQLSAEVPLLSASQTTVKAEKHHRQLVASSEGIEELLTIKAESTQDGLLADENMQDVFRVREQLNLLSDEVKKTVSGKK